MNNNSMTPAGNSELILTRQGTIFHLDIAPTDIAPTVITVGNPERVAEVSKYFDHISFRAQHREFITHTGYIGAKPISVISTGIGPDNIDIVYNELDALVNVDFATRMVKETKTSLSIFRLGTCGTLQQDIPVDSCIVSSHGIGLDNLMLYYRHTTTPDEQYILSDFLRHTNIAMQNIFPYIAEAPISLRKHFGNGYIHGITATCPGFYGPQGRTIRIPVTLPNLLDALATFTSQGNRIVNFEMETSAMYGLSRLMGHRSLSISTALANRATKTFSKNEHDAIENLIKNALEIIASI